MGRVRRAGRHRRGGPTTTWIGLGLLAAVLVAVGFFAFGHRPGPPTSPPTTVAAAATRPPASPTTGEPTPSPSPSPSPLIVPKPKIVWDPIPFPAARKQQMAAYAKTHYGIDTWHLVHPDVIVEHYTVTTTFQPVWNEFANDVPDSEFDSLPADCAHFVIDTDGTIHQLVHLNTMCRHTVGLNYTSIGIEMVGMSDRQILSDHRELESAIHLTAWLMQRFGIQLRNVIGHSESLDSPYHRELVAAWRCQTHADWQHADMQVFRAKVAGYLRGYGVPPGPPWRAHPQPGC